MTETAPIALFVHARPDHTRKTLEALSKNARAAESHLSVYADAARNNDEAVKVAAVRKLIRQDWGFANVNIIERESNYGLAANIREGVTRLVEQYGKIIVVEDDLVTSPLFLTFMNEALDRYESQPQVWHISGWTYTVATQQDDSAFFIPIMNCWGWGTWRDRWAHLNADPQDYMSRWDEAKILRFNIGGNVDNWGDLKRNAAGMMRTWAVFWYATIFDQGGLCLSPPITLVKNIGVDGSGVNSGSFDRYADASLATELPANWPDRLAFDEAAYQKIAFFLRSKRAPLWRRIGSKVKWRTKALMSFFKRR